jgi:hypothetical protein
MTSPLVDPRRCPVCGALNDCRVAEGSDEPCWCMDVEIPKEAIERIPLDARERACLCPRCARAVAD